MIYTFVILLAQELVWQPETFLGALWVGFGTMAGIETVKAVAWWIGRSDLDPA
jgi:hypothetical protein